MKYQKFFWWLLLAVAAIILISPLIYWLTGVGQAAEGLPADILRQPDGTVVSSPKAKG